MEHFKIDHDNLFQKYDAMALPRSGENHLREIVNRLDDNYVLNVNEEDYINYLVEDNSLYVPVVHFEDVRIEPRKVLVDAEYLPRYWMAEKAVERTVVRYIIPVEGDTDILNYRPSTWLSSGSGYFHISYGSIYTDILVLEEDSEKVKREYENRKDSLVKMLGFLEKDIKTYNNTLPGAARSIFAGRKEKIKRENSFIAGLGTPTTAQAGTPNTYSVPTVTKRYPQPENKQSSKKVEELTPVMDMQRYSQILDAIHTVGKMYESFPNVTKGMDEETLRDLFLAQIQTSFKTESATGEAFNKNGKTDIMVKHGDCILFIAECKFWKGKQVFLDAIRQLLSYLTWRDTKAALMLFVRDTSMTTAVAGVKDNIGSHANYKSTEKAKNETWLNYKFSMPNDPDRDVYLAVQLFDFSSKS